MPFRPDPVHVLGPEANGGRLTLCGRPPDSVTTVAAPALMAPDRFLCPACRVFLPDPQPKGPSDGEDPQEAPEAEGAVEAQRREVLR